MPERPCFPGHAWRCREQTLNITDRPAIMGILNVTPDSFSDGNQFLDPDVAIEHGCCMWEAGAAIIDVGGESTRPGAEPVDADEECRRVLPVIEGLASRVGSNGEGPAALLSIDTSKAPVAEAALAAGAHIVNDVSAMTRDVRMPAVVRAVGAGVVLMHMRGEPRTMQDDPQYQDVVAEVAAYLAARLAATVDAGIAAECVAIDPGIGFGKSAEHNLRLLRDLGAYAAIGRPIVVGLSRKRFLGKMTGRDTDARMAAGVAANVYSALQGAAVLRVHDVAETVDAMKMTAALCGKAG